MLNSRVAVLGAGMVGVATALELQRLGAQVTLIDRRDPGQETSYGNAGVIARSSLMPFNHPNLWKSLPTLLRNNTASLRYNTAFMLRNLGWGLSYLRHATHSAFQETTTALDALIRLSTTEHQRLLVEVGESQRLRDNGWLILYRSQAAFDGGQLGRDTMDHFGVRTQVLDRHALSDLEPVLNAAVFEKALWVQDTYSVDSPGQVTAAYARAFAARGGIISTRSLQTLQRNGEGWDVLDDSGQASYFEQVVVALGPWSKQFMGRMGIRVPMAFERGYHMHYAPGAAAGEGSGARLQRPVYDTGGAYVLSPMEQGLRLSTGVELNDCEAAPNPVQLELAETAARQALPLGQRLEAAPWMGRRPTLPDCRPIIGAMPGRRNLWLAFGHQHVGFSTGTGTAKLLGALMSGQAAPIDAQPFRAERFL
ncbi:MAG: FAD-binding oxidoreductase [Comamonas sp.]